MRVKAVQLLVNSVLPEHLRDYTRTLDSKGLNAPLLALAETNPEMLAEVASNLSKIGREATYYQGETLRLKDFQPVIDKAKVLEKMRIELDLLKKQYADDPKLFLAERNKVWVRYSDELKNATMKAAMAQGNNLGYSVVSGARGKPAQIQALITTPGLYEDQNNETIPLFVKHSFAEGLRPGEFLAGSYGARKAVVSTKRATAMGGAMGKMMVQATTPLIVTEDDCGVENGIDFDTNSRWARNRVLAKPAGDFPAGTVLSRDVLHQLRKKGDIPAVIVRSTMTCQSSQGVCAKCAGADPRGNLYSKGEAIGDTSSNALSEPWAQGALNVKHQGGQAGGRREYSGFDVMQRFVNSPEQFEDRAVVAENDGRVTAIEDAPQGGSYITLNGTDKHYVFPDYPVLVKVGDTVEAGQQMADGLVDPEDVVRLQGLGAGRRYYAERVRQIMDDSGHTTDPRNTEPLARSALDHVRISDPDGYEEGTMPDDIISYNAFRKGYKPPEDTAEVDPDKAVGQYLQKDALHYTIGTRITPSVASKLKSTGFGKVQTSSQAPEFDNPMVRLMAATHNNRDWLAGQYSTYLKRQLADGALRGDDTQLTGTTHFAPSLAMGVGFAKNIRETGTF